MVMMTSLRAPTSAEFVAGAAPSLANSSTAPRLRLCTMSEWPALRRFRAIGLPMIPKPMKPMTLISLTFHLMAWMLRTPRPEGPEKTTEVLDREDQYQRAGENFQVPENRHCKRHERAVEH